MKACRQERGWRGVLTGHLDNQEKIKENQGSLPERSKKKFLSLILAVLCFCLTACQAQSGGAEQENVPVSSVSSEEISLEEVPEYTGEPYVEVDEGEPDFSEEELTTDSYETYSELDELGRCQSAEACVGTDLMPEEEREGIGEIKPSGWHTVKYDNVEENISITVVILSAISLLQKMPMKKSDYRNKIHEYRRDASF